MLLLCACLNAFCTLSSNCHANESVSPFGRLCNSVLQCQPFWPNLFHGHYSTFGMINLKGIFEQTKYHFYLSFFIVIICKTIVFYRIWMMYMLHASLSPLLSTLNRLGARFPSWIVVLSHTETSFFFWLKTHKPLW